MVTLIQVGRSSGHMERCDARCHNATHPGCRCCCGGRYHGKQEGSVSLAWAVQQHQDAILLELGEAEERGELIIDYARASVDAPPFIRGRKRRRPQQQNLLGL